MVCDSIRTMESLNDLNFGLSYNNLGNSVENMFELSSTLAQLKAINNLQLGLEYNQLNNENSGI